MDSLSVKSMLLRNQDRYLELLHVDVVRDVRERREVHDKNISCDGFFFEHEGSLFALGAESGAIYLILNGTLLKHDDSTIETQLEEAADCNTFAATQHSRTLCSVTYKPIKASGWIANEDDECLDGFLWMHNVLHNPERRSLMITNAEKYG